MRKLQRWNQALLEIRVTQLTTAVVLWWTEPLLVKLGPTPGSWCEKSLQESASVSRAALLSRAAQLTEAAYCSPKKNLSLYTSPPWLEICSKLMNFLKHNIFLALDFVHQAPSIQKITVALTAHQENALRYKY